MFMIAFGFCSSCMSLSPVCGREFGRLRCSKLETPAVRAFGPFSESYVPGLRLPRADFPFPIPKQFLIVIYPVFRRLESVGWSCFSLCTLLMSAWRTQDFLGRQLHAAIRGAGQEEWFCMVCHQQFETVAGLFDQRSEFFFNFFFKYISFFFSLRG